MTDRIMNLPARSSFFSIYFRVALARRAFCSNSLNKKASYLVQKLLSVGPVIKGSFGPRTHRCQCIITDAICSRAKRPSSRRGRPLESYLSTEATGGASTPWTAAGTVG